MNLRDEIAKDGLGSVDADAIVRRVMGDEWVCAGGEGMNDAKQATPAAELERQICSATEPKNEREWWAHREIERLRDRLSVETLALVETLARAERAEANAANWEEQANDRVSDWDEVRAERDALKLRLAAAEDMNAACNADFSRIRAERDALRDRLDIRYDTVEGQTTGYGEDEIDRLAAERDALRDEGYRESSINFAGAAAILFVVTIIGCVLDLDVLT